jgi:cell division protein FtsB
MTVAELQADKKRRRRFSAFVALLSVLIGVSLYLGITNAIDQGTTSEHVGRHDKAIASQGREIGSLHRETRRNSARIKRLNKRVGITGRRVTHHAAPGHREGHRHGGGATPSPRGSPAPPADHPPPSSSPSKPPPAPVAPAPQPPPKPPSTPVPSPPSIPVPHLPIPVPHLPLPPLPSLPPPPHLP